MLGTDRKYDDGRLEKIGSAGTAVDRLKCAMVNGAAALTRVALRSGLCERCPILPLCAPL